MNLKNIKDIACSCVRSIGVLALCIIGNFFVFNSKINIVRAEGPDELTASDVQRLSSDKDCVFCSKQGDVEVKTFIVPDRYLSIENNAFAYCNFSCIIGKGIKKISNEAFNGCKKLKEVHIPNCIIIGDNCFNNCSNLKNVFIGAHAMSCPEDALNGAPNARFCLCSDPIVPIPWAFW